MNDWSLSTVECSYFTVFATFNISNYGVLKYIFLLKLSDKHLIIVRAEVLTRFRIRCAKCFSFSTLS